MAGLAAAEALLNEPPKDTGTGRDGTRRVTLIEPAGRLGGVVEAQGDEGEGGQDDGTGYGLFERQQAKQDELGEAEPGEALAQDGGPRHGARLVRVAVHIDQVVLANLRGGGRAGGQWVW